MATDRGCRAPRRGPHCIRKETPLDDHPRSPPRAGRLTRSAAVLAAGACAVAVALTTVVAGPAAADTVTNTIEVGLNPTAVAVSGNPAYATNASSNTVSVINTAATPPTVVATIPVGRHPSSVAVSGDRAYVVNTGDRSLSVIDIAVTRPTVVATTPVGVEPAGVAVSGDRAYVTDPGDTSVSVIDIAATPPTTVATIPLRKQSVSSQPIGYLPLAVAVSGDRAYVTDNNVGSVYVIAIDQAPTLAGTPAAGTLDQPYRYAFAVTGRPAPTVAVTVGALPDGLTLDTRTVSCPEPPLWVDGSSSRLPPPTGSASPPSCRWSSTSPRLLPGHSGRPGVSAP